MKKIPALILIILLIIFIFPFIPLVLTSLDQQWIINSVFPSKASFNTWKMVFTETPAIARSIAITIFIAMAVTLLNLFVAIPAAHALTRYSFFGKKTISLLFLSPLLVPAYIPLMGIHSTFISLGLTDSIKGVIISHMIPSLPYMMRALIVAYETIGSKREEQGKILGAKNHTIFFHITLPALIPGIVAGSTISILVSMSQYVSTLIIGGGIIKTITILMFPYFQGNYFSIASVLVIILMVITLFLLFIIDKVQRRYSTVDTLPQI